MNTTIQIRIDKKTKDATKKILSKLGLDISTAIKLYFYKINKLKGLPFLLLTENGFTSREENEILKLSAEAKKGKNISSVFDSADEAIRYLNR